MNYETMFTISEHLGPRENEPSKQGGSSFEDKDRTKRRSMDKKSADKARKTSSDGGNNVGGSRVHGKGKQETTVRGSLSGNKDKRMVEVERIRPGRRNMNRSAIDWWEVIPKQLVTKSDESRIRMYI